MHRHGHEEEISACMPPYAGTLPAAPGSAAVGNPYCPPYLSGCGSGTPYAPPYGQSGSHAPVCGTAARAGDPAECQPLRVIHVGQSLVRVGGIETCIKGLFRFLDPRRVQVSRCIVTPTEEFDPELGASWACPSRSAAPTGSARQARGRHTSLLGAAGAGRVARRLPAAPVRLCRPRRRQMDALDSRRERRHCRSRGCSQPACQGSGLPGLCDHGHSQRRGQRRPGADARAGHACAALGFAPDDFVIGFVGRFAEEKRVHLLVEAVAGLPPHFKALLVGHGYLRGQLMELANERIPGRYAFATAVNDVGDYYAALDALCLPSSEEGYALVILEAMLCGRPVIATPVGCVPEIFQDKVNGLIVDGSAEGIRAAARLLHRHPAWAAAVAAEGKAHAEVHGHARGMAVRYQELLVRLWREKQACAAG